jgi:hypothetical protein
MGSGVHGGAGGGGHCHHGLVVEAVMNKKAIAKLNSLIQDPATPHVVYRLKPHPLRFKKKVDKTTGIIKYQICRT